MKHISILVPDGENNLSSIVGAYKILTRANAYFMENGGRDLYKIQLVGVREEVAFHGGLFTVKPQVLLSSVLRTDLIIIPSLNHNYQQTIEKNAALIRWIDEQYKNGAEVASICTGAFLLAASGLLTNRTCSTHWAFANTFRTMFPEIDLQEDKIITDQNGIYTNGGAYSFLNLIIYLVEKYFDRKTAVFCSKVFQIEIDRHSQSSFIIFKGQKEHDDEVIRQAQEYIEKNVQERISMESLSSKFSVGRRNFDRRFIKATGNTPVEYAQRVKVEAAKKAFETNRKTISEVMFEVGYTDVKAFREVFRRVTGMSPMQYRNRYSKEALSPAV
ncbi:helix-turn-helix domain-containing protein [Terrimonas sp. NA20]|uniref:Helix-turn-helix domain-containing protein n=1 Tax=Terrimonas ginsenosidimutans TaxID=2908004 RepID=A0ABS9KQJ2_9BACT|nr:helix-turn-helix domain-containing protein [Terrimonas ginsenosidimutans]MCG2614588.1 helix-turn-helix domain-containing protein [Terrimonas ginsenosidimutans]